MKFYTEDQWGSSHCWRPAPWAYKSSEEKHPAFVKLLDVLLFKTPIGCSCWETLEMTWICSSWQLSICAICPQSLSFKWPWRRVMAESDVLDILLLAHISCAASNSFMILQPGAWTPWSEVTISQVIIVTALSLQAFCTKFRPSLGALVGRIFAAWRCSGETVPWAEALMKEFSLPSLSQSGGAQDLGPRGVSVVCYVQDQGYSPDPPSTYGCHQWCPFWMRIGHGQPYAKNKATDGHHGMSSWALRAQPSKSMQVRNGSW